jgi:translation initiation factor IF-3
MKSLAGKKIVLGVSGGIAAYKAPDLVRRLRERGAEVRVAITEGGKAFITPMSLQAVSGFPVSDSLLDPAAEAAMGHIELGKWAETGGKFLYEKSKSSKEQKKKQKVIQVKEIKFRPGTDDGDYQVKLRSLIRFLEDGDKAKITLRFRGREITHQQLGLDLLNRLRDDLADSIQVEQFPKLEGRQMVMMIAPARKKPAAGGKPAEVSAAPAVADKA